MVVGLLVGLVSFSNDFFLPKTYDVSVTADLIHAYIHLFNVSQNSGIGFNQMATYVFVFNVTNHSNSKLLLEELLTELAVNGSQEGTGYSLSGLAIAYQDFSESAPDGDLQPYESKLIGVVGTCSIENPGMNVFAEDKGYFLGNLYYSAAQGRGGARNIVFKQISLQSISTDEYLYGGTFEPGDYVYFSNSATLVTLWSGHETP